MEEPLIDQPVPPAQPALQIAVQTNYDEKTIRVAFNVPISEMTMDPAGAARFLAMLADGVATALAPEPPPEASQLEIPPEAQIRGANGEPL